MTDFSDPANFSDLQEKLDKLGLVITLKEPTDAMLKRGWHCIDFDQPEYVWAWWSGTKPRRTRPR